VNQRIVNIQNGDAALREALDQQSLSRAIASRLRYALKWSLPTIVTTPICGFNSLRYLATLP
jgi:hypothetical protein